MHINHQEFRRFHDASQMYLSSNSALRRQLRSDIDIQTQDFIRAGGKINRFENNAITEHKMKLTFNNQYTETKE